MAEFTPPSFLSGHSVDEVYAAMRAILPSDIDSSEGSHMYNFLRPTALITAELCEFILPQIVRTIFPEWSAAEYLDAHASSRGLHRKAAVAAHGNLSVTAGSTAITIPIGAKFSTAGTQGVAATEYQATAVVAISASGTATVPVECTMTGTAGNTPAGTVILVSDGRRGITAVTNSAPITGGLNTESDAELIVRILEYDRSRGTSFVGNVADYKRWAQEASDDVGTVSILDDTISPAGTVTMYIMDRAGNPATQELRNTVYNYIMCPTDAVARLAPVNATLVVGTPTTVPIYISATVELSGAATIATVSAELLTSVSAYLTEAMEDLEVRISRIGAILSGISGVEDYEDLKIGTSAATLSDQNITLTATQFPQTDAQKITLTEG